GQFLAPALLSTGSTSAPSVAVADLNGDGKPDVVAATSDASDNNGAVYVFYQSATSPGTFLAARVFPAGAQPQAVRIADLNGDGQPDIAVADSTSATIMLQYATAPGTFAAATQVGN